MVSRVCILGATGSIGASALDVIGRNRDEYSVDILTANTNFQKLFQLCKQHEPSIVAMACAESAEKLKSLLKENNMLQTTVLSGTEAINNVASTDNIDIVIAAIVGSAGLLPTLSGIKKNRKILLANKEALVMSGDLFMSVIEREGAILLPVDSEHNAIFQSLPQPTEFAKTNLKGVHQILLTGSGGPFLKEPLEALASKTPDEACAHPNWDMGRKISVDSATMMNKGLELIEACYLFNVAIEDVEIVIHPQSIVHSMVSYLDGSVIAQMGNPDMRTPIAHCLAWPKRIDAGVKPLDFYSIAKLEFQNPDYERYPCLRLAIEAVKIGDSAPCILNAANEIAVDAFLSDRIKFTEIAKVIETTLNKMEFEPLLNIEQIISTDKLARNIANAIVSELSL